MATPEDIIEAKRIANVRAQAQASAQGKNISTLDTTRYVIDPDLIKNSTLGKSAAQLEAAFLQQQAADAVTAAKASAVQIAKEIGANIDPKTGKIIPKTSGKTVTSVTYEGTGKNRIKITKYSDGTETREAAPEEVGGGGKKAIGTETDPVTGDVYTVYDDGTKVLLFKGTKQSDAAKAKAEADAAAKAGRQSAYDLLFQQFDAYGLGALVTPLRGLIESGINPAEFTLKLRETDAYKKRFAANAQRINKGLRALSEAEYIGLEDQYQDVMRRYGLPDTYYTRGEMGRQEGFEKFIGGDVSPVELEDRIQTAQRRVINAAPQIKDALTQYYGNEISNGDILAYVLDPEKAIENIKRKVTAAEIGGAASIAGLSASRARAEELGAFGVTGERARQGYTQISEFLEPTKKLGDIYRRSGMGPYNQAIAEQEVFGITGAADAASKRRKLAELETAQFSGQTGVTGGALGRERAGQF